MSRAVKYALLGLGALVTGVLGGAIGAWLLLVVIW